MVTDRRRKAAQGSRRTPRPMDPGQVLDGEAVVFRERCAGGEDRVASGAAARTPRRSGGPSAGSEPFNVPHLYICVALFQPFPAERVAHLDDPAEPLKALPDLFRSGERLAFRGVGADEAPEVDDGRADVGQLSAGHPVHLPVALGVQQRVEQVDVLLRERLRRGDFGTLPGEDGRVSDADLSTGHR